MAIGKYTVVKAGCKRFVYNVIVSDSLTSIFRFSAGPALEEVTDNVPTMQAY